MELLTFKYLGFDWAVMVLTFTAIYYIGNKNRLGLVLMMFGNVCWATVGIQANSLAMILANIAFLIMNVRAVYTFQGVRLHDSNLYIMVFNSLILV